MTEEAERINAKILALEDEMEPFEAEIKAGLQRIRDESVSRDLAIDERKKFYDDLQETVDKLDEMREQWNVLYREFHQAL